MNLATGHFTTLNPLKEYASPVTLAEKEILNPRPSLIRISIPKVVWGDSQLISNTLRFCQTQDSLMI